MESFLVSTGLVAIAEIGDKTQLLAFVLAARFRRPVPVVLGILAATLVNHGLAAAFGVWVTSLLDPGVLRWLLALSFFVMAAWTLRPDDVDDAPAATNGLGVFSATFVAFFIAEMGDKTQVATVAIAATYDALVTVVAGTTLGMLIANGPPVYLGGRCTQRIPMRWVRRGAALLFAVFGGAVLAGVV